MGHVTVFSDDADSVKEVLGGNKVNEKNVLGIEILLTR